MVDLGWTRLQVGPWDAKMYKLELILVLTAGSESATNVAE